MQIPSKAQHGLKVLELLATDGDVVKGRLIIEALEISAPYFEQITAILVKEGFIRTIRGCEGGYTLAREYTEKTVWDLIEAFRVKDLIRVPSNAMSFVAESFMDVAKSKLLKHIL